MTASEQSLQSAEQKRLKELWLQAASPVDARPGQESELGLALQVNFRIHLGHAFRAAWETSKAIVNGKIAMAKGFDPGSWLEVGAEVVFAVQAIFSSLVELLRPIDYISCVVLSCHTGSMSKVDFRKSVEDLLDHPEDALNYSWYLRITDSLIHKANEVRVSPDWFEDVIRELRKREFLEGPESALTFRSRHYAIRWGDE
jgi:hypothetical protein